MTAPTSDAFAALARSSPWRWSTLRFSLRWYPDDRMRPVHAWVRRPADVRVEPQDGGPATVVHERPNDRPLPGDPDFPEPIRRADGLVARRGLAWADAFDAPMYNTYFWVAMLDPVELAEGHDPDTGERRPGTVIADVAEVDHLGRPAWEAILRPTPSYQPRCACCAMLWSRESDLIEYGPEGLREDYPEAYRVRLDVGTGVCVLTEDLDGSPRGRGHSLRIEAVDEPMDDELFRPPPFREPPTDGPPRLALAPPGVQ